jgi:hypothetical protein
MTIYILRPMRRLPIPPDTSRVMSRVLILKITTPMGDVIRSFVRSEDEAYSLMAHWDQTQFIVELEEVDPRA